MATPSNTIDHGTLSALVEAGAVRGANVVGQPGGWSIVIQYGMTERALAAKRGSIRIFRHFETLVGYLKGIGVAKYQVDATAFDPVALKGERHRADASKRMKLAHETGDYDKWFRAKVTKSLAGIADGSNPIIPEEEWEAERAAWKREAAGA